MRKELTCIHCPKGCMMQVELRDGQVIGVTGNTCKRGEAYAKKEMTNPTRIVTSTVSVMNGVEERVPIKTAGEIPKENIFDCMKALSHLTVNAPVLIGDILVENVANTGVNIVATKSVDKNPLDR